MKQLILATDLDGTLAHGTGEERDELLSAISAAGDMRLIYVTGRAPGSARGLVAAAGLPRPDVLIADVGTSVLHGMGPSRVREIESALAAVWPGTPEVRRRLSQIDGVTSQNVVAPRRVSYWIEEVRAQRDRSAPAGADPFSARPPGDRSYGSDAARIAASVARDVERALQPLEVDVVLSGNVFLDVLPRGVNKGSTLLRVLRWLGGSADDCVVAGDSLNDLSLFETGLRSIVVGNCEPALLGRVAHMETVYRAGGSGAAGILEGLRHFGHTD